MSILHKGQCRSLSQALQPRTSYISTNQDNITLWYRNDSTTRCISKSFTTLSSLSVQCLDLGHLVNIRQSTERLPSKDTAGGTYSPCSWKLKNSQKHSCGRQAAPRTRIWEDHTKHLRVFCLLALALRVRNVRDASITQLGTTCS